MAILDEKTQLKVKAALDAVTKDLGEKLDAGIESALPTVDRILERRERTSARMATRTKQEVREHRDDLAHLLRVTAEQNSGSQSAVTAVTSKVSTANGSAAVDRRNVEVVNNEVTLFSSTKKKRRGIDQSSSVVSAVAARLVDLGISEDLALSTANCVEKARSSGSTGIGSSLEIANIVKLLFNAMPREKVLMTLGVAPQGTVANQDAAVAAKILSFFTEIPPSFTDKPDRRAREDEERREREEEERRASAERRANIQQALEEKDRLVAEEQRECEEREDATENVYFTSVQLDGDSQDEDEETDTDGMAPPDDFRERAEKLGVRGWSLAVSLRERFGAEKALEAGRCFDAFCGREFELSEYRRDSSAYCTKVARELSGDLATALGDDGMLAWAGVTPSTDPDQRRKQVAEAREKLEKALQPIVTTALLIESQSDAGVFKLSRGQSGATGLRVERLLAPEPASTASGTTAAAAPPVTESSATRVERLTADGRGLAGSLQSGFGYEAALKVGATFDRFCATDFNRNEYQADRDAYIGRQVTRLASDLRADIGDDKLLAWAGIALSVDPAARQKQVTEAVLKLEKALKPLVSDALKIEFAISDNASVRLSAGEIAATRIRVERLFVTAQPDTGLAAAPRPGGDGAAPVVAPAPRERVVVEPIPAPRTVAIEPTRFERSITDNRTEIIRRASALVGDEKAVKIADAYERLCREKFDEKTAVDARADAFAREVLEIIGEDEYLKLTGADLKEPGADRTVLLRQARADIAYRILPQLNDAKRESRDGQISVSDVDFLRISVSQLITHPFRPGYREREVARQGDRKRSLGLQPVDPPKAKEVPPVVAPAPRPVEVRQFDRKREPVSFLDDSGRVLVVPVEGGPVTRDNVAELRRLVGQFLRLSLEGIDVNATTRALALEVRESLPHNVLMENLGIVPSGDLERDRTEVLRRLELFLKPAIESDLASRRAGKLKDRQDRSSVDEALSELACGEVFDHQGRRIYDFSPSGEGSPHRIYPPLDGNIARDLANDSGISLDKASRIWALISSADRMVRSGADADAVTRGMAREFTKLLPHDYLVHALGITPTSNRTADERRVQDELTLRLKAWADQTKATIASTRPGAPEPMTSGPLLELVRGLCGTTQERVEARTSDIFIALVRARTPFDQAKGLFEQKNAMGPQQWERFLEQHEARNGHSFLAELERSGYGQLLRDPEVLDAFPEHIVQRYADRLLEGYLEREAVLERSLNAENQRTADVRAQLMTTIRVLEQRSGFSGPALPDNATPDQIEAHLLVLMKHQIAGPGDLAQIRRERGEELARLEARTEFANDAERQQVEARKAELRLLTAALDAKNLDGLQSATAGQFGEILEEAFSGNTQVEGQLSGFSSRIEIVGDLARLCQEIKPPPVPPAANGQPPPSSTKDEIRATLAVVQAERRSYNALFHRAGYGERYGEVNPDESPRFVRLRDEVRARTELLYSVARESDDPQLQNQIAALEWDALSRRAERLVRAGEFQQAETLLLQSANLFEGTTYREVLQQYVLVLAEIQRIERASFELEYGARVLKTHAAGHGNHIRVTQLPRLRDLDGLDDAARQSRLRYISELSSFSYFMDGLKYSTRTRVGVDFRIEQVVGARAELRTAAGDLFKFGRAGSDYEVDLAWTKITSLTTRVESQDAEFRAVLSDIDRRRNVEALRHRCGLPQDLADLRREPFRATVSVQPGDVRRVVASPLARPEPAELPAILRGEVIPGDAAAILFFNSVGSFPQSEFIRFARTPQHDFATDLRRYANSPACPADRRSQILACLELRPDGSVQFKAGKSADVELLFSRLDSRTKYLLMLQSIDRRNPSSLDQWAGEDTDRRRAVAAFRRGDSAELGKFRQPGVGEVPVILTQMVRALEGPGANLATRFPGVDTSRGPLLTVRQVLERDHIDGAVPALGRHFRSMDANHPDRKAFESLVERGSDGQLRIKSGKQNDFKNFVYTLGLADETRLREQVQSMEVRNAAGELVEIRGSEDRYAELTAELQRAQAYRQAIYLCLAANGQQKELEKAVFGPAGRPSDLGLRESGLEPVVRGDIRSTQDLLLSDPAAFEGVASYLDFSRRLSNLEQLMADMTPRDRELFRSYYRAQLRVDPEETILATFAADYRSAVLRGDVLSAQVWAHRLLSSSAISDAAKDRLFPGQPQNGSRLTAFIEQTVGADVEKADELRTRLEQATGDPEIDAMARAVAGERALIPHVRAAGDARRLAEATGASDVRRVFDRRNNPAVERIFRDVDRLNPTSPGLSQRIGGQALFVEMIGQKAHAYEGVLKAPDCKLALLYPTFVRLVNEGKGDEARDLLRHADLSRSELDIIRYRFGVDQRAQVPAGTLVAQVLGLRSGDAVRMEMVLAPTGHVNTSGRYASYDQARVRAILASDPATAEARFVAYISRVGSPADVRSVLASVPNPPAQFTVPTGWTRASTLLTAIESRETATVKSLQLWAELQVGYRSPREVVHELLTVGGDPAKSAELLASVVRKYNAQFGSLEADLQRRFPAATFPTEQALWSALGRGNRTDIAREVAAYSLRITDHSAVVEGQPATFANDRIDFVLLAKARRLVSGPEFEQVIRSLDSRVSLPDGVREQMRPNVPATFYLLRHRAGPFAMLGLSDWSFVVRMMRAQEEIKEDRCLEYTSRREVFKQQMMSFDHLREYIQAQINGSMSASNDFASRGRMFQKMINDADADWTELSYRLHDGKGAYQSNVDANASAARAYRNQADYLRTAGSDQILLRRSVTGAYAFISLNYTLQDGAAARQRADQFLDLSQRNVDQTRHYIQHTMRETAEWKQIQRDIKSAEEKLIAAQQRLVDFEGKRWWVTVVRDVAVSLAVGWFPVVGGVLATLAVCTLHVWDAMKRGAGSVGDAIWVARYELLMIVAVAGVLSALRYAAKFVKLPPAQTITARAVGTVQAGGRQVAVSTGDVLVSRTARFGVERAQRAVYEEAMKKFGDKGVPFIIKVEAAQARSLATFSPPFVAFSPVFQNYSNPAQGFLPPAVPPQMVYVPAQNGGNRPQPPVVGDRDGNAPPVPVAGDRVGGAPAGPGALRGLVGNEPPVDPNATGARDNNGNARDNVIINPDPQDLIKAGILPPPGAGQPAYPVVRYDGYGNYQFWTIYPGGRAGGSSNNPNANGGNGQAGDSASTVVPNPNFYDNVLKQWGNQWGLDPGRHFRRIMDDWNALMAIQNRQRPPAPPPGSFGGTGTSSNNGGPSRPDGGGRPPRSGISLTLDPVWGSTDHRRGNAYTAATTAEAEAQWRIKMEQEQRLAEQVSLLSIVNPSTLSVTTANSSSLTNAMTAVLGLTTQQSTALASPMSQVQASVLSTANGVTQSNQLEFRNASLNSQATKSADGLTMTSALQDASSQTLSNAIGNRNGSAELATTPQHNAHSQGARQEELSGQQRTNAVSDDSTIAGANVASRSRTTLRSQRSNAKEETHIQIAALRDAEAESIKRTLPGVTAAQQGRSADNAAVVVGQQGRTTENATIAVGQQGRSAENAAVVIEQQNREASQRRAASALETRLEQEVAEELRRIEKEEEAVERAVEAARVAASGLDRTNRVEVSAEDRAIGSSDEAAACQRKARQKRAKERAKAAQRGRLRAMIVQQLLTQELTAAMRRRLLDSLLELGISESEFRQLEAQIGAMEAQELVKQAMQQPLALEVEVAPQSQSAQAEPEQTSQPKRATRSRAEVYRKLKEHRSNRGPQTTGVGQR